MNDTIPSEVEQLEQAAEQAPLAAEPSLALSEAYARLGRHADRARLHEERAALLLDRPEGPPELLRAAQVYLDALNDPARARALCEQALSLEPGSALGRDLLVQALKKLGQGGALATLLERWANEREPARAAELLVQAAELYLGELKKPAHGALCLLRAFRLAPDRRDAIVRARALLVEAGNLRSALELLHDERHAFGGEGLADEYAELAARLAEWPIDFPVAREAAQAALSVHPEHARSKEVVARLDREAAGWAEEAKGLRASAPAERDRKVAGAMHLRVAQLHLVFDESSARDGRVKDALEKATLLYGGMRELREFVQRGAEARGDFAGLESALEGLAKEAGDRASQAELYLRLGRVRLSNLDDRPGALAAFAKAAQLDPSRADAACLAAEVQLDEGRPAEAAALWEAHLAALPAGAGRVDVQLHLAHLYARVLSQADKARAHLLAALRLDPTSATAAHAFATAFEDGEPEEQAEFWERTLHAVAEPAARAERLARIASLRGLEGAPPAQVLAVLSRALLLAPGDAALADQLLTWAEKATAWALAARALRVAAQSAPEAAQPELWKRLARVLEDRLARPEVALQLFRRVAERRPDDADARAAIERLLQRAGASEELLKELQARAEAEKDPATQRKLWAQVAAQCESLGSAPEQAVEAYRRMLTLEPADAEAWHRLYLALRAMSRWQEAYEALGHLAELAPASEALRWRVERAELLGRSLNKAEQGLAELLSLLEKHPGAPELLGPLEALAQSGREPVRIARALLPHLQASGDFHRAAGALQTVLGESQDATERERLQLELASLYEEKLVDNRAALAVLLSAAREHAGSEKVAAELGRLALDLGAATEAWALWLALARDAHEPAQSAALAERAGSLAQQAGLHDRAAEAYALVLEKQPAHPRALPAQLGLLRRQERWVEAELLLRARAERAAGAEQVPALLELAEALEKLNRHSEAASAIEQAIGAGAEEEPLLPRLAKALEGARRFQDLEKVLARELKLAEARGDQEKVARLNLRRTRILEASLGDRDGAIRGYADILAQRPSDPEALTSLEGMLNDTELRERAARALIPAYEAIKEHRRLVHALEVLGDAAPEATDKVGALKRAAQVYANDLRQPELAFAQLARALRLAASDAALRLATRRAAEEADQIEVFAEVIGEVADLASGPAAIPLHRELAEVCERRLGDRDRAVTAYQRVLVVDPQNLDALRGLHRLFRATEKFAELAKTCRALAEVVFDDSEKASLYREAGALCEGVLKDPEGAAAAYRKLTELSPLDKDAAAALDRLYSSLARPSDLAYALELRRAQEGPSPQGREFTFRLAELKRTQLGDLTSALLLFEQILAAEPTHVGARNALEAWVRASAPDAQEALKLLDPVLEKAGDHPRRIALRDALIKGASTELKSRLYAEIRGIYQRDLAQPEMAFVSACRAFDENIDREKLAPELEKLARETNNFDGLCEVYEDALQNTDDEAQQDAYWRRAATLRAQLGQVERAIELWKGLSEKKPGDREALDALTRLYEKSQNAQNLAALYRQKAQLAATPEERVGLLLQSAAARDQMEDVTGAVETLREVIALDAKNLKAWQQLDAIYPRLKKPREHADVLRALAELTQGPQRKGYLLRRAALLEKEADAHEAVDAYAVVLTEFKGEPAAVAGLERLFIEEPVKVEVAKLLEPVYRGMSDQRRLADVLEARLGSTTVDERKPLLAEVASLREALGQKPLAFALKLRSFRDAPEDLAVREDLERLGADTGSFEELAAAYQDELDRNAHPELAVGLWRSLANLYAERLGAPDQAARALEMVAKLEPTDAAVLDGLARLYRRQNELPQLADVYRRQVKLEQNARKKRDLLYELAQLCEERLSDPTGAIDAYQQLIQLEPNDGNAVGALRKLYSATERFEELSHLMEKEAELARAQGKSEEALDITVRLGRLKITRLQDPRGAFDLFRAVLELKPGHAGAVGALEEMAKGEGALRTEAALALEPVFATGGDHQKLVAVLEARANGAPPLERSILFRQIAEVYGERLGSPEMAFMAATRALREAPDEAAALECCVEYVGQAGLHEELEELIGEVLGRVTTDEARIGLHRAQANLCRGPLKDLRRAADAYLRILEIRPADAEALDQLSVLLRDQGEFETLLEIYRRKLGIAETDDARAALLLRMAELQDEKMRDPAGAIATLHRLLHEVKPDDRTALARLDALCLKQERWVELADVLQREVALTEGREAAQAGQLKLRLAALRETKLQDRSGALVLYKEILAARPDHEDVIKRLEDMLAKEATLDEAAAALEGSYRAMGNVAKLSNLLETRAGNAVDSYEKKRIYTELATIRAERQNRPELAFMALCKAFREDPSDAQLRRTLERIAAAADSEEELVALYEEELPRVRDEVAASDIAFRTAVLMETKLEQPEESLKYYEQALALDPETGVQALPALDRFYRAGEKWAQLAEVLRRSIDATPEPREKVLHLQSLAQILDEKLEQPDQAADAYEQILKLDPKAMPALRGLEKLYDAAQHWDRLYRVLEIQRDVAPAGERERILARMAQVSSHGLSNSDQSIQLYQQVLEKNPRSDAAFLALEGLYDDAKRFDDLADLLKRKLSFTVDPREIVRLNDKLGRALTEHLNRDDDAVVAFKAVLDRDPRHRRALEHLRDIYEKQGKTEDLVTMLRRLIPVQDDQGGVKQVRLKLAEVLSGASRKDEALDAARRVLDVEPHTEADLLRAEELFRKLNAFPDAVKAMEHRANLYESNKDVDSAVNTLFNVAEVQTVQLKKREQALGAYERILTIDPKNRLAFDQLRSIAKDVGDWRRYTNATDRFLPAISAPEEHLALLKEIAEIQIGKLAQSDLAFLTYCRAFREAPTDAEVRGKLGQLAGETESWDVLATVYEEVAESSPKGPVAEIIYAELASIQDEHLDEPDAAEQSLRKILEFDPANHTALNALGNMHARRGKDSEYISSLEQKLEVTPGIEERKGILREIARVYDEKQHNAEEAINTLQRALSLEADRPTLDTLCHLLRREKKWNDLVSQLIRARDLAAHPAERAELQFQVAEVYVGKLNDDEAAIAGYRQALEFDPTHREANTALEQLYTKLDRSAEQLSLYNQQLEFVQDSKERIKILFKAASIWEDKYQNLANADQCLHAILDLDMRNLQAIKALERLKRSQGKWEELVQVYDRHLAFTSPQQLGERVELLLAQGDVWYQKLSRVDRAAEIYGQALAFDPKSKAAMHALGVLYERSGNWPFALEMLAREAEHEHGPESVELHHRMGKINEDMLMDSAAAKAAYQHALQLDPAYLPSLRQLKGIYQLEKDGEGYVQTLIQEAKATLDAEEKTTAWVQVADFYRERDERDTSATYYEEALKVTADCLEAARPLADIYVARENWERAEAMLDIVGARLTDKAQDDAEVGKDLCRQLYRLGYVCEKLGKSKKALEAYRRAYQLDATYLPALEGLGNLLVGAGEYDEAYKVYQTILLQHKDDLTDLEVVEIYWQLGEICLKTKQNDRALNFFEKALAIDPTHESSQRAMVELSETVGQYDKALTFRRKLAEVLEGDEYFQMQLAIGKLCRDKLHDPFGAIDAFNAALKTRPDHLSTLDQLLALYRETHQGPKAVEMLERILEHADVQKDVLNRKKGYFALGETLRDEIKDDERAIAAFNTCLDLDPKFVQAFSAIENMLASKKQWKKLEENYVLMVRRLPKTEDTHAARMALWRTLADLYLRVLKNPEAAMMAYEVVAKSSPDDITTLEQFAALAAEQPTGQEKAIAAYRQTVPQTASPGKTASALAKLHALRKEYDEAYVAAQVVVHLLGEGGAEEREILTKLGPYAKRREQAQKALTDRMWTEMLFHPKVKGPLGEILALLQSQAGPLYARKHAEYGIDPRKHKIELGAAEELAINTYKSVLRTLSMEQSVELYSPFLVVKRAQIKGQASGLPPEQELFLDLCHTSPLCLKAGGALFKQSQQKELQFYIAKTLAFSRPELALARLLPIERLEAVFQAAILLCAPSFRVTADPRMVDQEKKRLEQTLTQPAGSALAKLVRAYLKVQALGDVRAFIEGAELTANRAGVLLSGQVEAAKTVLEKDQGMAVKLPARSKIRDLMVFCLSTEYAQLREGLGINVEVRLPGQQQPRT